MHFRYTRLICWLLLIIALPGAPGAFGQGKERTALKKQHTKLTAYSVFCDDDRDTTIRYLNIDGVHRFSARYNVKKNSLKFLRLKGDKWQTIGAKKLDIDDLWELRMEDLNGDGVNEVLAMTGRNMNGNQWIDVFVYDTSSDSMIFAGNLNTEYTVNKPAKTITIFYTGSWYMDNYKELIRWQGNKLVPAERVVLTLKNGNMENDTTFIDHYLPAAPGSTRLKRVSRQIYNSENKRQQKLWNKLMAGY